MESNEKVALSVCGTDADPEQCEVLAGHAEIVAILAERFPERDPEQNEVLAARIIADHPELADPQEFKVVLVQVDFITSVVFPIICDLIGRLANALSYALSQAGYSIDEFINALAEALAPYSDENLRAGCVSPREWHLYKHAKRFRTRKKYMNRFIDRISKMEA